MKYKGIVKRISAAVMGVMIAANVLTAYAENGSSCSNKKNYDVTDLSMMLSYMKGTALLDEYSVNRLDMNSDGSVNVTDLALISCMLKGINSLNEERDKSAAAWELKSAAGASVLGGGCGRLVALKNSTSAAKKKTGGEYVVISTSSDKVVRSFVSDVYLQFVGIKKDGTVIMSGNDPVQGNMLYFYKSGRNDPEKCRTDADYLNIKYDDKNDMLYCIKDNAVYVIGPDGKLKEQYRAVDGAVFKGIELSKNIGAVCLDGEGLNGLAFVSLADGQTLWETVLHSGSAAFTDNTAVVCDGLGAQDNGSETSAVRCFDLETGEKKGVYKVEGSVSKLCFSDDSYCGMIATTQPSDHITFFDPASGRSCKVDVGIKNMYVTGGICLDDKRWVVNISEENSRTGKGVAKNFVVAADKLIWEDTEQGTDIEDVFKPVTCGEALRAQREKADKLEEKYGITILIGDEVKNAYKGMISAEDGMYAGYPEQLDEQLNELSIWLSTYPEGFFDKFKTADNKSGYRLLFAGGFEGENVVAKTTRDINYVDVAISSKSHDKSFYSDLDHETWHAVEYLAAPMYGEIDGARWAKLLPEGFSYTQAHGSKYRDNILDHGYYSNHMDDISFIRDYSMENEREDRSTIMEYAAPSLSVYDGYDNLDELKRFPVLKAKLDMMGEMSRKFFGYVYWEEMAAKNQNYIIGSIE